LFLRQQGTKPGALCQGKIKDLDMKQREPNMGSGPGGGTLSGAQPDLALSFQVLTFAACNLTLQFLGLVLRN
jgi:hypothetical protein